MSRGIVMLSFTTIILTAVQISIASPLRVQGVVIMLVWLWPLSVGLTSSTLVAVLSGVLAGMLFDSFTATPFGVSALVGGALGYLISFLAREGVGDLDAAAWWVPPAVLGAGGFLAPLLFVIFAAVTGHPTYWRASLLAMMIVNFLAFFILARPVARLAQRIAEIGGWARG